MTTKEKAVTNYVREKHNQDECIGFIDGYNQCQEDMADESIRFADWILKNKYERCCDNGLAWWGEYNDEISFSTEELFKIFIHSLNKQD